LCDLTDWLRRVLPSGTAEPGPLSYFCRKHEITDPAENVVVVVGRVAGRAGAVRAITPSMPPHVCPQQGRRRLAPEARAGIFAACEVTDFALGAVYGLKMVLFAHDRAAGGQHRGLRRRRRRRGVTKVRFA
jgi:hypothetical protein